MLYGNNVDEHSYLLTAGLATIGSCFPDESGNHPIWHCQNCFNQFTSGSDDEVAEYRHRLQQLVNQYRDLDRLSAERMGGENLLKSFFRGDVIQQIYLSEVRFEIEPSIPELEKHIQESVIEKLLCYLSSLGGGAEVNVHGLVIMQCENGYLVKRKASQVS